MDIYKMLKENSEELLKEDLEFLEVELATGNYDRKYINECMTMIKELRKFKNIKQEKNIEYDDTVEDLVANSSVKEVPIVDIEKIKKENISNYDKKIDETEVKTQILKSRKSNEYKKDFTKIFTNDDIKEEFIDKIFSFFKSVELDELLKIKKFSEEFLEKYFKLLNKDLISEKQLFSEAFFMKHFNQLNYEKVLKKGQNDWINKDIRSSKLTVFLKLKGIKL